MKYTTPPLPSYAYPSAWRQRSFGKFCDYLLYGAYYFFCRLAKYRLRGRWHAMYDFTLLNNVWECTYIYTPEEYICLFVEGNQLISLYTTLGELDIDRDTYTYLPRLRVIETSRPSWRVIRLNAHVLEVDIPMLSSKEEAYIRTVFWRV